VPQISIPQKVGDGMHTASIVILTDAPPLDVSKGRAETVAPPREHPWQLWFSEKNTGVPPELFDF